MADAAGHTDSNRMKSLAGASAALTAVNTKNSLKDDPMGEDGKLIGPNGTEGQTATQKAEDIRVSLTYGASQSHSHSEQKGTSASSSSITAGGDVNLTATGDKNSDQGNINIIGSDINAGHNVSLDAANTINILAAQDTNTNTSRNTSSSGAIGVAASAKDHSAGVTASASYGQGNSDGHDVTQVNSHITAGNGSTAGTASLTSGGDTNIKGGVVTAHTINADVGGNLNIESLQDTSTYKSHQIDVSGSATVGYGAGASGSLGMSKVGSDYASITEQSGLKAGDGGFNINVKGNTDLKGAVISSTQAAIDQGKNTFKSTTLTQNDINNHASYDANSVSVSAGVGGSLGGSAGVGHDSGNASSVTQSGISGIAGNTSARTGDAETGIAKIFDATKVQSEINAQTQITAAFSQQAPKAIATYSGNKAAELRAQGNEAEAKKWDEGGIYRIALHTVSGGLSGGVAGALGAGAVAYEANNLTQMQTDLTNSLAKSMITPDMTDQEKQAAYNKANMIAQGVMELTAAGVGAVASGGSVQGAGSALAVDTNNRLLHPVQKIDASTAKLLNDGNSVNNYTDTKETINPDRYQDASINPELSVNEIYPNNNPSLVDGYTVVDSSGKGYTLSSQAYDVFRNLAPAQQISYINGTSSDLDRNVITDQLSATNTQPVSGDISAIRTAVSQLVLLKGNPDIPPSTPNRGESSSVNTGSQDSYSSNVKAALEAGITLPYQPLPPSTGNTLTDLANAVNTFTYNVGSTPINLVTTGLNIPNLLTTIGTGNPNAFTDFNNNVAIPAVLIFPGVGSVAAEGLEGLTALARVKVGGAVGEGAVAASGANSAIDSTLQSEIDALNRIKNNPNGADLTNKPIGTVASQAGTKKLDDVFSGRTIPENVTSTKLQTERVPNGTKDMANDDFNALNLSNIRIIQSSKGEIRMGNLPDGSLVKVRPSLDGGKNRQTIEISKPNGKKSREIRYGN